MLLDIFLLVLGFTMLIKGADIFVDAASMIARRLGVSSLVIGLTIVAFGTSLPEILISTSAAISGSAMAIGNIVGSNMFNLFFIVGFCALIKPFKVNFKEISFDFYFSIVAFLLLFLIKIISVDYISRIYSIMMLVIFAGYMFVLFNRVKKNKTEDKPEKSEKPLKPIWLNITFIVIGGLLIAFGSDMAVGAAESIAQTLGISERIIGLTILAIGTSLPELVIFLVSNKNGDVGIGLGNIIGSGIFNTLFILGIAGSVSPLVLDPSSIQDSIVLVIGSIITLVFIHSRKKLNRIEGTILFVAYGAYMSLLFI